MDYDRWLEGPAFPTSIEETCPKCNSKFSREGWYEHGRFSPLEDTITCPVCDNVIEEEI